VTQDFFSEVVDRIPSAAGVARSPDVQGLRTGSARARQTHGGPSPDRRSACGIRQLGRLGRLRRGTFDRPGSSQDWIPSPPVGQARRRIRVHRQTRVRSTASTTDIAPEGRTFAETEGSSRGHGRLRREHMARTGVRLLWGTANLFGHPLTLPAPPRIPIRRLRLRAAQVKLASRRRSDSAANYVLWVSEGYDTLLNTDLAREDTRSPGSSVWSRAQEPDRFEARS